MLALVLLFLLVFSTAQAQESLQVQIEERSLRVRELQAEIAKLQVALDETNEQKQTLQNAIKALDLNIQKLTKSITLTQTQIAAKDQEIRGLSGDISDTAVDITEAQRGVADSLRQLAVRDGESAAAVVLGGATLSSFFDEVVTLSTLRSSLHNRIEDLSSLKTNLETSKAAAERKRRELGILQKNLSEQKQGLAITRTSQNQLLQQTKNKESNYQALIAEKQAQQAKFEAELEQFEAQLGLSVNAENLPHPGSGVLRWPLDQPFVTQYFGNTSFATANPQIYAGRGHNAIDLRASPGTPIKAARSGVVLGTGDTDTACPNASYGKWIFIRHDNGLSTLYAHLSATSIGQGSTVLTGAVIGYSGSTGYATGPHLHFGVYATEGSKIGSFPSKTCKGRVFTVPLADPRAYLNPLSYL